MKTAVVFYSLDGNCVYIAAQINDRLNADTVRLRLSDEKKHGKIGKFFWGGGMVFLRKKPPLKPYTFDPSGYDLIIIGMPVWAGSPAPPVRTFLSQTKITGKKIALFVCHAGGMGNALKKFKAMLPGNEIAAEADFINPVTGDSEKVKQQIEEWVKKLENL